MRQSNQIIVVRKWFETKLSEFTTKRLGVSFTKGHKPQIGIHM